MENNTNLLTSHRFKQAVLTVLTFLAVFLIAKSINEFSHFGARSAADVQDTITVQGKGEVFAVPDIATFSFSITEQGKDVAEANNKSSTKNNAAMKYLKDAGIAEKDIQTTDYSANPQYDYSQVVCVKYPCPQQAPKLIGYEVSQTVSVKIRNTDKAGDILSGVGALGVTNISGLTFTIDDEDSIRAEARAKAITDARAKADELVKQLGVRIDKVSSFSEDGGGVVYPMYAMQSKAMDVAGTAPVAPEIAKGQNKITVNVNVTYRIK
ncbi:MAG: SIMPL domain-containing protein [Patescibacteria group bacterium]